jgi:hypothetical protein
MGIVIDPLQIHEKEIDGAVFRAQGLTGRQVLSLSAQLGEGSTDNDAIYEVVQKSVKSWTGVTYTSGEEIPCTPDNIDLLPVAVAVALFEFVASLSGLTGEEAGNS